MTTTGSDTKNVFPLRTVTGVAVSEKSGSELNPHYFWMAHEYILALDCEHSQVRIRDAYFGAAPEQLRPPLPKRVRCETCAPKTVPVLEKAPVVNLAHDPLASALLAAAMPHLDSNQQDGLFEWLAAFGSYIADEVLRARVYGAVGLRLIDEYLAPADQQTCVDARRALGAWSEDPNDETRKAVSVARRRVYSAQNRGKTESNYHSDRMNSIWYARRGIHSALNVASAVAKNAVSAVMDSIVFDKATRDVYYDKLDELGDRRRRAGFFNDRMASVFDDMAMGNIPADAVEERSRREAISEDEAREQLAARASQLSVVSTEAAFDHVFRFEAPTIGAQHLWLLIELIGVYADAYIDTIQQRK